MNQLATFSRSKRSGKERAIRSLSVVSILILWQLIAFLFEKLTFQTSVIISPFQTILRLFELAKTTTFWQSIFSTILLQMSSFLIAIVFGALLSILAFRFYSFSLFISPFISIVRILPTIAVIVFFFMIFPWKIVPFIISFLVTFPLLYTSFYSALNSIPNSTIDAAKSLALSFFQRTFRVLIPETIDLLRPIIIQAFSLNFKVVIAAEILGLPSISLGNQFLRAKQSFDFANSFCYLVVVIMIAYISEKLLEFIIKKPKYAII